MLKGKVAAVTGSTGGIGNGVARALAEAGAAVALNSHRELPRNHEMAAALGEEFGVEAAFIKADMSDGGECAAFVTQVEARFGRLDILVNNAGIQHVSPIEDFPPDMWERIIAINLSSSFHTTRAAFPGMKAREFGRVINIASAHGLVASPFKSAYVSAKHGLLGFTKTIALEGAEHGITSNAICPGYVWTPLVEKQVPDQAKAHGMSEEEVIREVILAPQPTRKFATVEDIGALAVFLASEPAHNLTGAAIPVDGGWTAR